MVAGVLCYLEGSVVGHFAEKVATHVRNDASMSQFLLEISNKYGIMARYWEEMWSDVCYRVYSRESEMS